MIRWEQDQAYLHYAENILGVKFDPRAATWLTSCDQSGRILGVVVFSRFSDGNCEITVAAQSKQFISKRFGLAVAFYAFEQLGCRRVTAVIAVGNEKSLNLAQQLGFRIEGRLVSWYASGDAFILGLLKSDCKWLKGLHGFANSTDPA